LPRNPNLRVNLKLDQGNWRFTLHKDSQAHCGVRGYGRAVEAVEEVMILPSCLRLANDQKKRRGVSVEQPSAQDGT
jgi:hypothetical protein